MKCEFCGALFTDNELEELREMGESFYLDESIFICPDCYDRFEHLSLEEQFEKVLQMR